MTQIDSFRPVLFRVTIDGSSFSGNVAPNDGFIDPTSTQKYEQSTVQTGTVTNPVVNDGDVVDINGTSITFTTAGGLNLAGIITTINEFSDVHHVIASNSSNKLVLKNEKVFENFGILLTGSVAVLTALGYVAPVVTTPYSAGGATLANNEAKMRGNSRWESLMKLLNFEANTLSVGSVVATGGTPDAAPSTISFTVAYQNISSVYTYDELNNNALIKGDAALTRMVARALVLSRIENRVIINPGTDVTWHFTIGDQVEKLTIGAIAANIAAANSAITVVHVPSTR